MLETLIITFREGLEAFLIVAITLAYLNKTGRSYLRKPVYFGCLFALFISATTGWHIAELANDPFTEGVLSIIAGGLVASLTYYVMKTAGKIKDAITDKIEVHASKNAFWASAGIFIFTALMISREGMETALMLGAISSETNAGSMLAGAILGISLTALIGVLWVKQSSSINLKLFMQVTGIFLILFSIHLFLYGVYELTEVTGSIFYHEGIHGALKPFVSSKSLIGQLTIYGLLALPLSWLAISYVKDRFSRQRATTG
jgi:high-affinity iron transporter